MPIGYEILLDAAMDADEGRFAVQAYRLVSTLNHPFELMFRQKPILQLKTTIDREKVSNYSLKLIALDGGEPMLFGEQTIEINVKE